MWIMKRWIALILTMSIALSDFGGITVFAAEDTVTAETLDSEDAVTAETLDFENDEESLQTDEDQNHEETDFAQNEDSAPETEAEVDTETEVDTEAETGLPALHIGQINKGEELPSPDDSELVYDLPVSFEMSDSVLLFVNYNIDTIYAEGKGTLVWSILRGENGMEEGSVSLINEEDDWVDFEIVSDSPFFTMTENEDEESDYYQTVELAAVDFTDEGDREESKDYNYYIRAAYYLGTGEDMAEEFYAAATIAFLPIEDADIDETQDDVSDAEEINTEETLDEEGIDTEESQEDVPVTEETLEEEAEDDALIADSYMNMAFEDDDTGNDAENATSEVFESDEQQNLDGQTRRLLLDVSAETPIEMHPNDIRQVTATIVSVGDSDDTQEDTPVDSEKIVWESSDINVAVVEKGVIRANTEGVEGYAQITAQYDGLTATAVVKVVQENAEQILNLDGDIWIVGFQQESEDFVYTGQKITQDIRVYYNEILLKEKTDYTVTYKNNVNAAVYNSAKAPSVTIKLKGQYSGSRTLYFTILPRNIDEDESMGYEQVVQYAKTLKIPAPTLYYNNKKLTSGKDFVCDYTAYDESSEYGRMPEDYKKGDSYEAGKIYEYTVNGTGNFNGSFKMRLVVVKDKNLNLSSATITLDKKQYEYHGEPLSKEDVGITVKFGKSIVDECFYEYEVYADSVGTGYIEIDPSDAGREAGYRGTKKVNIKVVGDRQMKDAMKGDGWQETIVFSQKGVNDDGGIIQAKEGVLVYVENSDAGESLEEGSGKKEVVLREGEDYTVKYSNHKKVGTATATFTGVGRYKGTLKLKYQITPNIKAENFTIVWKNVKKNVTDEGERLEIEYQKGGAVPDFVLMDQDKNILKNKTDYTVKLTNNKTPGTYMTYEITGKGNYKGYAYKKADQIMVMPGNIGRGTITVSDKQRSTKANAWKSKPTIKDVSGKTLTAGKDYAKEFEYTYTNTNGENVSYPEADTVVTIKVNGINNYEGSSISGHYRIFSTNISKLIITIDAKEYTGKEITLVKGIDIHAYATSSDKKKKINEITSYEIVEGSYKNNIKAGTAKVTLRGTGNYGGTKTYSFKINKKKYAINSVKKIALSPTSLLLSLYEKDVEKRKLTFTLTPSDAEQPLTNSTVIWTTSNSNIATVEDVQIETDLNHPGNTTVTAIIVLKKAGSATITAIAQDGSQKKTCNVTIVDVPVLKELGQTIKMEKKATYQLGFESGESQEPNLTGLTFSSSNTALVSISNKGVLTAKNKAGIVIIKVTKGKLVQECYAYVEGEEDPVPETYRTFEKTSGSNDDTAAIRKAIVNAYNDKSCDGIYIPYGVYHVDATANLNNGIYLDGRSGWDTLNPRDTKFEIRMSPGTLLLTKKNNRKGYHVICLQSCSNITISGGAIIGERKEHTGTGGEAGHGIAIYDSKNIEIKDMDISQCWGDGIYLGTNQETSNKNIKITNCDAHDNRRNNLSITSGDGVTISGGSFNNAKGTDPQFGIDIETNNHNRPCRNITIRNTTIKGNAKGSMGIMTNADTVILEDCTLSGNFYNWAGKNVILRRVKFESGSVINNPGFVTIIQ